MADTGTLGMFANKVRAVTATDWVSLAPTHTLQSNVSGPNQEPNAQLKMTDANKTIEAKVAAHGTISLQRGDANGQSLKLGDDKCVLKNGANHKLRLMVDGTELTAQNSTVSLVDDTAQLRGGNSMITCNNAGIKLDSDKVVVGKFTFDGDTLKATKGVAHIDSSTIKIG